MTQRGTLTARTILAVALAASAGACAAETGREPSPDVVAHTVQALREPLLLEFFDQSFGTFVSTGPCSIASSRGRCDDTASLTTTFDTSGFSAITLEYTRLTARYDAGETFVAEFSTDGGATWQTLETLGGTASWATFTRTLPASADNARVSLRFRANASGTYEWFEIDDVIVTGDRPGDRDCDARDDDSDGRMDEGYQPQATSCGIGSCRRSAQTACVSGAERNGCVPGTPASGDATCNGVDDDCDGEVDENGCATPEIVIDNTSPNPRFTTSGAWSVSTSSAGWFGSNYAQGGNNDTFKTAKWAPDIQRSGAYAVYMWYPAASTRSATVPVTIQHDSGCTARQTVSQRVNGGRWNLLGTFDFRAATDGYVMIRGGGGGYTIADAVRFVRVGDLGPGGAGAECAPPRCYQPGSPPAAQTCAPDESAPVVPRATTNSWQRVELPNTICSDGSQYKFWVNFTSSSNNLLVMYQGGGGCWSYETCTGSELANQRGIPDDLINQLAADFPILNRTATSNPTRNFNYVVLPYCTGDVQAGSRERRYVSEDGNFDELYRHAGSANMSQVIAWIDAQFPVVPRMLVTGCSAGGFSSIVTYDRVRRGMSGVQCGYMLDDSGAVAPSAGPSAGVHAAAREAWNLDAHFDTIGGPACPADAAALKSDFGRLNLILADRYPRDRLALTLFQRDLKSKFSYQEFLEPQSYLELLGYFGEDVAALRALYDTRANLGYYLPYRRAFGCSHCTTFSTYDGAAIGTSTTESYLRTLLNNGTALPRQTEGSSPDGDWTASTAASCFTP